MCGVCLYFTTKCAFPDASQMQCNWVMKDLIMQVRVRDFKYKYSIKVYLHKTKAYMPL